ncbi:hypothetical protein S40288_11378 [Stachybotrys chartarum IBT 40288]|nr:hypothetical protein S40288_11378 [Stachybotrys chartarum IBT 40288]
MSLDGSSSYYLTLFFFFLLCPSIASPVAALQLRPVRPNEAGRGFAARNRLSTSRCDESTPTDSDRLWCPLFYPFPRVALLKPPFATFAHAAAFCIPPHPATRAQPSV